MANVLETAGRLDAALVARGFFASRAQAQAAIRAGRVRGDGDAATKPAARVGGGARVEVDGPAHPYVSRGGVKLAAALDAFAVDPAGAVCLDLGASTGGFTDVLLRRGARRVYAVDVGCGQLAPAIAADRRVVNLEKTHVRDVAESAPEPASVVVADLSFIGLRKALPPALACAAPGAALCVLVKPQFEMGPAAVGKGGIVKASDADYQALTDELSAFLEAAGWASLGVIESPIAGGDGNREFLLGARRV
ncbi:MAG: TlyA family RNA methyltransferase [Parvularculaceae bacterium]